ncbi:MAG: hypothetical protein ACE5JL_08670 [Dehalococcoidia bacterium]
MTGTDLNLLDLRIIPMEGAAGVSIGGSKQTVLAKLGKPLRSRSGAEGMEFLEYAGVAVTLQNGKVLIIRAEQGYRGSTPEGLKVAATWKELRQIYPTVTFHEDELIWYVPGINGLSFDIVRPPRPDEQPMTPPWVDEVYEILDPEHAFVLSIAVHQIRYDQTEKGA